MNIIKKILNILLYVKCLFLYFAALVVSPFAKLGGKYKNFWLVAERGADARDNGYHFFKYMCQKHPEVNCAYVIDKKSPDFEKVRSLGRTVQTGTFGHYIAFVCAKVKVSTHVMGFAPDSYCFAILDRKFNFVRGKKIFLQHGIIKDDIAELHYGMLNVDLFICSTVGEYETLVKDFGYPEKLLGRVGLCRYDALNTDHEVKRQILVMPTWRYYLRPLDEAGFRESEYYTMFNSLLSDKRLHKMLEENDYELHFYLHFELQKFSKYFGSECDRIKIRSMADADVQQLLMESSMLITDYSSVFFDFAYMRKPLAHWMFDYELFRAEQYGEGYFNFDTDGLGPVFKNENEVVDRIEFEIKNDMIVEDKYKKRIEDTFAGLATDHCEQTYRAILDLL